MSFFNFKLSMFWKNSFMPQFQLCKYLANKTVTTCRCESRYNWNELLNEPAMSAIRCKDVYDSGSGCDKFCQVQTNKTTKAASGDLQVFSQKQLETWRYNCRYFFNRSTVSVCACDSDKGQCADFDYGSEYKKYLFQLSTLLLSPFILTIGFILLVILFYYFLAYRLKSEGSVCFSI